MSRYDSDADTEEEIARSSKRIFYMLLGVCLLLVIVPVWAIWSGQPPQPGERHPFRTTENTPGNEAPTKTVLTGNETKAEAVASVYARLINLVTDWDEMALSTVPICPSHLCAVFLAQEDSVDQYCVPFKNRFLCSFVDGIGSRSVVAADFEQDGDADAVFFGQQARFCRNRNDVLNCVILGDESNSAPAADIADFDLDGDLDVVIARDGQNEVCEYKQGTFNCYAINGPPANTRAIALGDLNLDGYMDIVFSNEQPIQFCFNSATSPITFDCALQKQSLSNTLNVELSEFSGNSQLDALFLSNKHPVLCTKLAESLGNCVTRFSGDVDANYRFDNKITFDYGFGLARSGAPIDYIVNRNIGYDSVSAGDINGDGKVEFVLSGALLRPIACTYKKSPTDLAEYWQEPKTPICSVLSVNAPPLANDHILYDIDEDGRLDIVFANGQLELWDLKISPKNAICYNRDDIDTPDSLELECVPFNLHEYNTTGIAFVKLDK